MHENEGKSTPQLVSDNKAGLGDSSVMRAHIGDQIVVEGPAVGMIRRDGQVVGLHHTDGSPPYDVRWSDTGHTTLFFPGPDAHVRHLDHPSPDRDD